MRATFVFRHMLRIIHKCFFANFPKVNIIKFDIFMQRTSYIGPLKLIWGTWRMEKCIRFDSLRNATIFIHLIGPKHMHTNTHKHSERGVCAPAAVQANTDTVCQRVSFALCVSVYVRGIHKTAGATERCLRCRLSAHAAN